MSRQVCSTDYVYQYFFQCNADTLNRILDDGRLRPLSDFPESARWQGLEAEKPGFYKNLYDMIGKPIINKPYKNSGVFMSAIDFDKLPDAYLHGKPRFKIPVSRLDPDWSVITYVWYDERIIADLHNDNLQRVANFWTEDNVRKWFGADPGKVFFHVPQVAAYQPEGVHVSIDDLEYAGELFF
jgi:hypothetical protein